MGIHGIYKEIGSGRRIALSKFALDTFINKKRPLRLAVDISIWLFQIKSSKGGEQPALRTFYYRLLRLTSLAIHPLFVFDGPNKPKFKRNKHTGPNICTIPEFLAKQLLKEFGLPYHVAPGEAEAECAQLQRAGVVDAVLSEDVDTIMFGSGITLRNWSAEGKGKVPTHVNVYDSQAIKQGSSGLDREGMILVAMMSGGDYIPEGIPGCGPKTACEAARAGFGAKLCKINRGDTKAFEEWKTELAHELRSNESKYFRVKHGSLQIPDAFPHQDILRYYTHPAVSDATKIEELRRTIVWERPMQLAALRKFTEEAFKWETVIGAKKFIRTLAPALIIRQLSCGVANDKSSLILKIHQVRQHASTDNVSELRISYVPQDVVDIDLSIEAPEDTTSGQVDGGDDEPVAGDDAELPSSTQMRPYLFDPSEVTKAWIFEHFVRTGAQQQYEDWKKACNVKASKVPLAVTRKGNKSQQSKGIDASMPTGAMHLFARISKPYVSVHPTNNVSVDDVSKLPFPALPASSYSNRQLPPYRGTQDSTQNQQVPTIDLASANLSAPSRTAIVNETMLSSNTSVLLGNRRRSPLVRARTEGSVIIPAEVLDLTAEALCSISRRQPLSRDKSASKRKAQPNSPLGTPKTTKKSSSSNLEPIMISSSPVRQESITDYFSPSRTRQQVHCFELTQTSPTRRPAAKTFKMPAGQTATDTRHLGSSILMAQRTHMEVSMEVSSCKSSTPMSFVNASTTGSSRICLQSSDGNKQRVRVRESLRGAFALEAEDFDSVLAPTKAVTSTWSLHDVSVMDMTGDL